MKNIGKISSWLLAACLSGFWSVTLADCNNTEQLKGVNLAGAEFNGKKLPGRLNWDYIYPDPTDIRHFHELGMNVIRLPFLWERIQPKLYGDLDPSELRSIQSTVATAQALDMCVVLDVHNYGAYRGNPIGSEAVPAAAFFNLWVRLAKVFRDPASTAFGLMNEPAKVPVSQWYAIAQRTVDILRVKGTLNLLLVPSARWSGAHEWAHSFDGISAASEFSRFRDPRNNYVIELHQYADSDYSGTHASCIDSQPLGQIMERVTQWGKENHKKLFLAEFGTPDNRECLQALGTVLNSMSDPSVWRGWSYWAAGRWWGGYPLSIQPEKGINANQTEIIIPYLR